MPEEESNAVLEIFMGRMENEEYFRFFVKELVRAYQSDALIPDEWKLPRLKWYAETLRAWVDEKYRSEDGSLESERRRAHEIVDEIMAGVCEFDKKE